MARTIYITSGPEAAFDEYLARAEAGSAAAQAVVAFIYLNKWIDDDAYLEVSTRWARLSAEQNNSYGRWVLAWALLERDNAFDGVQAMLEAAEDNFAPAQHHLASFLVNGVMFPKNLETGFELFRIAADAGHNSALRMLESGYKLGVFGTFKKISTKLSQPLLRPFRFIHWFLFKPKFSENDLVYARALHVENALRRKYGDENISYGLENLLDRMHEKIRSS